MTYRVEILRRAAKVLARTRKPDSERLRRAIRSLSQDPRPVGCKKLTGRDGWRVRVGRYRIIYDVEDTIRVVTIVDLGDRKDIYD